jgi:hypothetical protein
MNMLRVSTLDFRILTDSPITREGPRVIHNLPPVRVAAGGDKPSKPVIGPFPDKPYSINLDIGNKELDTCTRPSLADPDVASLCGSVIDLTDDPASLPYFGNNDSDILYVGSLAKVYTVYAVFELRWRVESHAKKMIGDGLSTDDRGWENKVFSELKASWQKKMDPNFPSLPKNFPRLSDIFTLSKSGDVSLAEQTPGITDNDLNTIGEFGKPEGKFKDWMRLMLRWSNNTAASKCILALGYSYINGALAAAGFFDKATKSGLWISGDYAGHDWLAKDAAGLQLTARWQKIQKRRVTNFTGTSLQIARFLGLMAQGKLIDPPSCIEMVKMMTATNGGIGSYIKSALLHAMPRRDFTSISSKIGYGNDEVSHDCAIVRVEREGDPGRTIRYISVVLGSPPEKGRVGLSDLAVTFHDCVLSRHP